MMVLKLRSGYVIKSRSGYVKRLWHEAFVIS